MIFFLSLSLSLPFALSFSLAVSLLPSLAKIYDEINCIHFFSFVGRLPKSNSKKLSSKKIDLISRNGTEYSQVESFNRWFYSKWADWLHERSSKWAKESSIGYAVSWFTCKKTEEKTKEKKMLGKTLFCRERRKKIVRSVELSHWLRFNWCGMWKMSLMFGTMRYHEFLVVATTQTYFYRVSLCGNARFAEKTPFRSIGSSKLCRSAWYWATYVQIVSNCWLSQMKILC